MVNCLDLLFCYICNSLCTVHSFSKKFKIALQVRQFAKNLSKAKTVLALLASIM